MTQTALPYETSFPRALTPIAPGTFRKQRYRRRQRLGARVVTPQQVEREFQQPIVTETPEERHERKRKAIKPRLFYTPSALTYLPPPGTIARSLCGFTVQGRV